MRGKRPQPPKTTPPATPLCNKPAWLAPYAAEEWDRVTAELKGYGANIGGLDQTALVNYCVAVGNVRSASEIIEREGHIINAGNGSLAKHPAITVLNQAQTQARTWAVELWLTPASKGKIPMAKAEQRQSKFKAI
jgi:P27 family predicted phage terminase small subunit